MRGGVTLQSWMPAPCLRPARMGSCSAAASIGAVCLAIRAQIPLLPVHFQSDSTAANSWIGTNITGWSHPDYDAACQAAMNAPPQDQAANLPVQQMFAEQLPVLPLYYTIHLSSSRPDLCGLQVDGSARSDFWNLENIAVGADCP